MKMYPLHKNNIIEYFTKLKHILFRCENIFGKNKKELFEGIIFGSGKLQPFPDLYIFILH